MTAADAAAALSAIGAQASLVSGTNIKTINGSTLLGSGDLTVSGLSGTGSVDNAVLRADGTGGATLQNSAIVIDDLFTASPNNTVNFTCLKPTGGTTNVGLALVPKGTGAFTLAVPDGTTTGGNARGTNAVDLQSFRSDASHVASGQSSVTIGVQNAATASESMAIGRLCVASGLQSCAMGIQSISSGANAVAIGYQVTASGQGAVSLGWVSVASGQYSFAAGRENTASGSYAVSIGSFSTASGDFSHTFGLSAVASRHGMIASAAGTFAAAGDAQAVRFVLRNKTTNNTATTLFLNGSSTRLTVTSGTIIFADVLISGVKSDGSAAACYKRKVAIKNVAGTTSLIGSVETIGTDIEDNASTDVSITADDTNDALQINVTGITGETWRWVAVVEGLEIAYGT
jgi:hypothetical protein